MPIHDWSRVDAGIFHDFHIGWIGELRTLLNEELLPDPYYALAESVVGEAIPDVLALEERQLSGNESPHQDSKLGDDSKENPLALAPSSVLVEELDLPLDYTLLQRRISIRDQIHGDRVVAFIEIVSKSNKDSEARSRLFVSKATTALRKGIHFLFIDLHPATSIVPGGFHQEISDACGHPVSRLPAERPLQTASYQVLEDGTVRARVVPLQVGDLIPEMPVFLLPHHFIRIPLERAYASSFRSLSRKFQNILQT